MTWLLCLSSHIVLDLGAPWWVISGLNSDCCWTCLKLLTMDMFRIRYVTALQPALLLLTVAHCYHCCLGQYTVQGIMSGLLVLWDFNVKVYPSYINMFPDCPGGRFSPLVQYGHIREERRKSGKTLGMSGNGEGRLGYTLGIGRMRPLKG